MANSLAIAYQMQKKRKKFVDGGMSSDPEAAAAAAKAKDNGGNYISGGSSGANTGSSKSAPSAQPTVHDSEKYDEQGNRKTMADPDMVHSINQYVNKESLSQGGIAGAQSEDHKNLGQHIVSALDSMKDTIVDRIMAQRSMGYESEARLSKGGMVANEDGPETDSMPNEFDDLVLDDKLESSYGDDNNAGDETGDAQEDDDRQDIVSRIMRSRAKKDRMPRPA